MANVLFTNVAYVKEFTIIDDNVDEKNIRIAIKEAQEIEIRRYIGSGLYDEIAGQIQNSTLTALNQTLLDSYIQPALVKWVVYRAAPFFVYKFTNKNISRKNSDNSSGVDFNELDRVMEQLRNDAEYYTRRMVEYLLENETSYPLYQNPGNGIDTIFPSYDAFTCSIFLGGTKKNPTSYPSYGERCCDNE